MKPGNAFEEALKARSTLSSEVKDGAAWVTEALDLCWASARAIFEEKATPEIALAIFDRVVDGLGDEDDEEDEDDEDDDD